MKKHIPKFFKLMSLLSPQLAAKLALKLFMHPQRKARSTEEMDFLETGQQITFKSQRKARSWGKGAVVWLIHGWESRGSTFYKLIPLLVNNGYQVVAWDGPAHGDSPGNSNSVPKNAKSLSIDMNEQLFSKPIAIIGHSFGGSTFAVFSKIHELPPKIIVVSAPSRIRNIFTGFAKIIKLSDKATNRFVILAEQVSGYSLEEISLVTNDFSKSHKVLIIHDREDDVIPFADFEVLKKTWTSGQFIATKNLGHRLTIKDPAILNTIVAFIEKNKRST